MFKELKETMSKELNGSMRMMSHQTETIFKEIEITFLKREPNRNQGVEYNN